MKPRISMRRALADPNLLRHCLPGDSWRPWRTFLIGCVGEPLDDAERTIWQQIIGRQQEPGRRAEEIIGVVGRRGGKAPCDHRPWRGAWFMGYAAHAAP
jgi:hypothetical protein